MFPAMLTVVKSQLPQELDRKAEASQGPLARLQREHDLYKDESTEILKRAQEQCEQVRRSFDSLSRSNREIER